MSAAARKVLALVTVTVSVFAAGYLLGFFFAPPLAADPHDEHEEGHVVDHEDHLDRDDHGDDHEEEEHVALTRQAFDNLGLKLSTLSPSDYWKSRAVPGEVVEIPGWSKVSVSAPVTGVIESVLSRPGQSVVATDNLFTMRITDEQLTAAQSKLLASIARAQIVEKEIARLVPLTSSGAVAGRRKRDLEYELAQLQSTQAVLRQEMLSRGLPQSIVDDVAVEGLLASALQISAADCQRPDVLANRDSVQHVSLQLGNVRTDYAIEQINVYPGQAVERGDELCVINNHTELYIRGQAFESDLPLLDQLTEKDWSITAEFGHNRNEHDSEIIIRRGLRLLRVDNVVDADSQTFVFFLPLTNEIAQTLRDDDERSFINWRFKPGQRVRLNIPAERWEQQLVLPLAAVVTEGPNSSVFVEHVDQAPGNLDADDDSHDHHDEHDAIFIELEPVPVRLLHRDDRYAVIADDGQFSLDHRVAMNAAYELHQAMKMQASGGGGHHHHHDH